MPLKPTHVFYLTFMNYSIQNLVLLPDMLEAAGRDVWLSTLFAMAIALMMGALLWLLEKMYPGQSLLDVLKQGLPKAVYAPIFVALGLYLLLQCFISNAYLGDFVNIGFLQETPLWVILTMFSAGISYTLRKGIVALANLAGLLTFTTILSGWTMSFAITGHRDMSTFLPVLEHGMSPVLYGSALFTPIWVEILFIAFLPRRPLEAKVWWKTYVAIIVVNTVLFLGHTVGPISVFGLEQSENLNFPALSAVKVISLGFIDRFDIYGLMLMIFGSIIRVGMNAYLAITLVEAAFGGKRKLTEPHNRATSLLFGAVLAVGSSFIFQTTAFFSLVIQQILLASLLVFGLFLISYTWLFVVGRRRIVGQL